MSEFVSISTPMSEIYNNPEIVDYIKEKYDLVVENDSYYFNSTFSKERSSGSCIEITDSNLTFDETISWIKGVLEEDKDIYANDPNKIIIVNGGGYSSIPGRGWVDLENCFPKAATSEIVTVPDDQKLATKIAGFVVPFMSLPFPEIKRLTKFTNINIVDGGKTVLSAGDGALVNIISSDLTKFELINWMNHIILQGENIYPNRQIIYTTPGMESLDEEVKTVLKDCIPLYEFKKNLLSK